VLLVVDVNTVEPAGEIDDEEYGDAERRALLNHSDRRGVPRLHSYVEPVGSAANAAGRTVGLDTPSLSTSA
jgi:hypothetical protein